MELETRTLWRRKWQPTPVFLDGEVHGRGPWRAMGLQRVGHNQGPEHTLLEADMRTHCPVLRQTL